MPVANCPASADLERLYLGGVPENEATRLEQHVLTCDRCLEKVKALAPADDLLAVVLAGKESSRPAPLSLAVESLMQQMESLRLPPAESPLRETPMIKFSCSSCAKSLSVKDNLSGKKVKCPGCGQVTPVPAAQVVAAPRGEVEERTLPPSPEPESRLDHDKPATLASSGVADATEGVRNEDTGEDNNLIDFLSPPQSNDELGRLGKYRILKILGHGGMGVVYKAEDPKLMRTVALKAMLPALAASASAGKRFLREAQAMAAVEHDHIVRIYQVDEDRNVPYMAMEFLKGEPLDERLKREEKMPLDEVLRIGREITRGLDAAHKTGLIHRDIKPGNIWLEAPEGRVKILDFGLARAASQDSGLTQQGAIIGTPAYMAPEQGRGEAVDGRTDLFSLGVILYRLCSGQQPFRGNDTVSTIMEVALHEPPPPRALNVDTPPELSELVMKLLEKDPAKRIASAGQVVATLQAIEKKLQQGDTFAGTQPVPVIPPPRRRPKVMVAVAAMVAIAALAAGIVYFMQTPKGTIRIEIDDPNIEVTLTKTGATIKGVDKHDIKLEPGEHGFRVKRGDLDFETDKFVLKKGETFTLKVELLPGKVQVTTGDGKVIGEKVVKEERPVIPTAGNYALEFNDKATVVSFNFDSGNKKLLFSQPFTLEAWVKPTTQTLSQRHILSSSGSALVLGIGKEPQQETKWYISLNPSGKKDRLYSSSVAETNRPARLAMTSDGKTVRLFVDGKLANSAPLPADLPTGTSSFKVGAALVGLIDDIRISTVCRYSVDYTPVRPEKDADTLALYHCDEGSGDVLTDSSGNGHHGKVVGAKWVRSEGASTVGTPLFNGKDFTGFSGGPFWKVWDGMFLGESGGKSATLHMLKTQAEYTDFEATFRFKYPHRQESDGGKAPTFAFRKSSVRPNTVISFQKNRIILSPPMERKTIEPRENDFNDVLVRCQGKHVKVMVNGETMVDGEFDTEPAGALTWYTGEAGNVYLKDIRVTDLSKSTGTPLFNGKDFTGFSSKGSWNVEDGVLKGKGAGNLQTHADFTDFEVSFRISSPEPGETDNSGPWFAFRTDTQPKQKGNLLFGVDKIHVPGLQGVKPREKDFNDVWVRCVGTHTKVVVNGETLVVGELNVPRSGRLTWKAGSKGTILKDIRITDLRQSSAAPPRSLEDDWLKEVAAMPAEKQVEAVVAKLKERNPRYDGKETHVIGGKNQEVSSLTINSDEITDISPIRALAKLDQFVCRGTNWGRGTLVDLSPLKGMKLTQLDVTMMKVGDLSPLEGMRLAKLHIPGTDVTDLSVVKGMPLESISFQNTKVTDYSPIKNLPLFAIRFGDKNPPFWTEANLEIVRSIKSLANINGKPTADFWKEIDEKKP